MTDILKESPRGIHTVPLRGEFTYQREILLYGNVSLLASGAKGELVDKIITYSMSEIRFESDSPLRSDADVNQVKEMA